MSKTNGHIHGKDISALCEKKNGNPCGNDVNASFSE